MQNIDLTQSWILMEHSTHSTMKAAKISSEVWDLRNREGE